MSIVILRKTVIIKKIISADPHTDHPLRSDTVSAARDTPYLL